MRPLASARSLCTVNSAAKHEEKRREERVSAALPVNLGTAAGITRDVSASGIFFETDATYTIGRSISLTVELETPGGKMMLKCEGEIVRVEQHGARIGIAVKIVDSVISAVGAEVAL